MTTFQVGDSVEWEHHQGEWTGPLRVEHSYTKNVYRIGNGNFFVDMVPADNLRPYHSPEPKEKQL